MKYKFTEEKDLVIQTALRPAKPCIIQGFVFLDTDGKLYIYKGYSHNGVTLGIDFKFTRLAALVHDALFQLMQEGLLPMSFFKQCNLELKRLMIANGSSKFVAKFYYFMVQTFGKPFAKRKLFA